MKQDKEFQFSIRTDLAVESREMAGELGHEIDGIKMHVEEGEEDIVITHVEVINEMGMELMGKPIGKYITIESQDMKGYDTYCHEKISEILSDKLHQLCRLKDNACVLVIGLGNWQVTPDALGPKVVSKTLVTRHLYGNVPEELENAVRPVAAIAPGVMGLTGIETAEIVKGIVERIQPDLVIAIDALAARKVSRINATIQMSDTGVSPGSGMGNMRKVLNQENLGVPVVAIGVPTVVDAATLVNDTMDKMLSEMAQVLPEGSEFFHMLEHLDEEEKYGLIVEILKPYAGNMFVTPKEVDAVIERLANIIANAINIALHPGISKEDMNRYLQA